MAEARTLKYGDIMRIHGMSKGDPNDKGILSSKGFTDPNIYYQKYEDFSQVNLFRESLFQIIPKTSFHINDELLKDNLQPKEREAIKIRAVSEEVAMNNNLIVRKGTEVLYGAEVLFKHVDSGGFLLGVLEAAESGEGSFKLNLTDQLSSGLGFKIRSHRSYERDGDKVYLDDPLEIYHSSSDCYVNFNEGTDYVFLDKEFERLEFSEEDQALAYLSVQPRIKIGFPKRINVVNQNKSKCLWRFILYQDYDGAQDTNTIKPHDIVYFERTYKQGLLTSSLTRLEVTIKQNNLCEGDITFYDSLWEMIPVEPSESGPEQPGSYFARNIITGKYLCLKDELIMADGTEEDGDKAVVELMDDKQTMENSRLVNLMIGDRKIDCGDLIPIDASLPKIKKSYIECIDQFQPVLMSKNASEHSFKIFKPPRKELSDILFVLSSFECINKFTELIQVTADTTLDAAYYEQLMAECTDGVLEMVSYTFKALIGRIFECNYSEINNAGKTPSKKVQKIMVETGLTQLTISMIYFMARHDRYISGENPEYRAQRNKLSTIFEDAYRLLEKIVINCEENRIYISRWVELIMDHSYNINKSCIQECLVGILQNNSISIEETINDEKIQDLVRMFKEDAQRNGPQIKFLKLLSAFIKCAGKVFRENQERILRMFFQDETNDYRFKFKCIYKGTNESDVDSNSELTKLGNSREVQILYGKRDALTLNEFFKNEKDVWNYFLEYVNLMADVCMDTNSNSIEVISGALPLQHVLVILSDPNVALVHQEIQKENAERHAQSLPPKFQNIYEPFIRIAHHVYVNIKKFSPIRRISKIEYWNSLNPNEDILRTKRVFEGEKEQEEKKYLKMMLEFIRMFLEKCELNPNNITEMTALYTTLDLLRITVTLGLWDEVRQFREILPALFMKIIKFDDNYIFKNGSEAYLDRQELDKQSLKAIVAENKQNIKMIKPEMTLAIDCKNKAADIFNLMIEMETNIRVTNLTIFFKNLYEAKEDYEKYKREQPELAIESETAQRRNDTARQAFLSENSESFFGKNKKRVEQKEIILEPNIWLNKLRELTPTDKESDTIERYFFGNIEDFDKIVMALFEVSEHQNWKMLNSSMLLLRKIFGQRQDLIQNFNNIVLCSKGNFYDITVKVRKMKQKFNMLRQPEIINYVDGDKGFAFKLWKPYDQTTKDELGRSGIIQDLFFLSRVLKKNTNLKNIEALMTVDEEIFKEDRLYPFYNEREQNDRLFQTMALVQQIHTHIFAYIERVKEPPRSDHQRHLLFSIYNYLTLLVFNNLENKQHLMQYIKLVLPHLKYRVGVPQFIYNICFNNKILVNSEDLVRTIVEAIVAACGEFSIDDYERSNLLFSLRGLVLFNEKGHERNQKLVLSIVQKNRDLRLIENRSLSAIGVPKKASILDFNMPPVATYMTTMFELFSVLVESKNMINIGKLSNIHTYTYLLSTLRETNYWQLRRAIRAYINRLYYLNTDDDNFLFEEFIRNEFFIISQELSELVEIFTKQHEDRVINNPIRFSYAGSHTYLALLEILTTLYNVFEKPVFMTVFARELEKRDKKQDNELHNLTVKIANNLGFIVNNRYTQDMKSKMTGSYIHQILEQLRRFMLRFTLGFLEETCNNQVLEEEAPEDMGEAETNKKHVYDYSKSFFRNLYEMIVMVNAKKRKDRLIKEYKDRKNNADGSMDGRKKRFIDMIFSGKLVEGALNLTRMVSAQRAIKKQELEPVHYNSTLLTTTSRHFRVQAKPTLSENEENLALNRKLNDVKLLLQYSPLFHKFKHDEFIRLVRTFTNLDDISKKHYTDYCARELAINNYDMPVVSMDEVFKNMFKLTMEHPTEIQDQYKIPIIKLVRCYISEAIERDQEYKLGVDCWDAKYTEGDEEASKELENRQNRINACGGAEFIVSILKENLDERVEVFNEVLLLGIVFLFGGNRQCQNSILDALKADPANTMLVNLNSLIKRIGQFVESMNEKKETKDKREKNFNFPHEDTYDYYNEREKVLEKKFGYETVDRYEAKVKTDHENALVRCFRFLQLFCQNNNVDMKNFLLTQTDESGVKKNKTINFIETTTLLLRKFFKIINYNMSQFKIAQLLDFINECTQIPCKENQKALTKSSYFEDVCYMSSFFASQENLKSRLYDPEKSETMSQLHQIYQKSVMLALSNLEGNDDQIYSEFISKCEGRFLWEIAQRNLEAKIEGYKEAHNLPDLTLADFDKKHIKTLLEDMEATDKVFDEETINILNIFTILLKVRDYGKLHKDKGEKDKQAIDKAEIEISDTANKFCTNFVEAGKSTYQHIEDFAKEFENLLIQIEINCSSGKQYVYFPFNPVFKFLAKDTKNRIMAEVNRETQRDKLVGLLGYTDEVFGEIEWNYQMKFQSKVKICSREIPVAITSNLFTMVRKLALGTSILIMVLMLLGIEMEHDTEEMVSEYSYGTFPINFIMKLLSLMQLGLSLFCMVLWVILRYPLALAKQAKQEEDAAALQSKSAQNKSEVQAEPDLLTRIRLIVVTFIAVQWERLTYSRLGFVARFFNWVGRHLARPLNFVKNYLVSVGHLLKSFWFQQKEFGPLLLFVLVSFMGNFLGMQYFTIHIFDIFLQVSLLGNVFKAITGNFTILGTLSALAGAFIFVFNVLGFGTYSASIYPDDLPEDVCENLFDCVLIMYNSGAIGDNMDEFSPARFSFDLIYVVFMELLFQNLFGGVIIDSFTELREKDDEIKEDKEGMCFICGKDRAGIENENQTFEKHIIPHDLWNYLYFIFCLQKKDETDYSGMEYEINDKIVQEDISWFPLVDSDAENEAETKFKELEDAIRSIKNATIESHDRSIKDLEVLEPSLLRLE